MKEIIFQRQLSNDNCMSACLAMLTAMPVEEVTLLFHSDYKRMKITPQRFLAEHGVSYSYECRAIDRVSGQLEIGDIYILSTPSISIRNTTHAVVLDYRCKEPKLYDPSNRTRKIGGGEGDLRCWTVELVINELA